MIRNFPHLSDKPNGFGAYEIHWTEKSPEGRYRTRRRSTKTSDRQEAEAALAHFLTLRDTEAVKCPTVQEIHDAYMAGYAIPRGSETSESNVMIGPLKCFATWKANTIRDSDIEAYTLRRQKGAYGRTFKNKNTPPVKAKPSTIRREIVALQARLNWASKKQMIPGSPEFRFTKPQDAAVRDLWLTEDQERDVLRRLPEAPLTVQIFLRLGLTYGVRCGAIMDLKFGDQINFITNTIDFNVPGRRVTRKRRPVVPMTRAIRAAVEEMHQTKKRGDRVCDYNTTYLYEKFMASIGYEWVTPHVLKHSAITLMLRAGVKELDVSRLTATDLRTIARVYRHHSMDELAEIAERRGR